MIITFEGETDSEDLSYKLNMAYNRFGDLESQSGARVNAALIKSGKIPNADLLANMTAPMKDISTANAVVLPPAIRYINQSGPNTAVLFERPPFQHTFEYVRLSVAQMKDASTKSIDSKKETVTVNIPWTLYAVVFNERFHPQYIYAYMSDKPIQSLDDQLVGLATPNVWANGRICMAHQPKSDDKTDLLTGLQRVYGAIWHSGFNFDLTESVSNSAQNGLFKIACTKPGKAIVNYDEKSRPIYGPSTRHWRDIDGATLVEQFFKEWSTLSPQEVLDNFWPTHNQPPERVNGRGFTPIDPNLRNLSLPANDPCAHHVVTGNVNNPHGLVTTSVQQVIDRLATECLAHNASFASRVWGSTLAVETANTREF